MTKQPIETIRTIAGLRARVAAWRQESLSVGMVPTMGALHAGHVSLVDAALSGCDRVVVTLFVNPTQFAPSEDFGSYPRDEARDRALLAEMGVAVLFAPETAEMYPPGEATRISVGGPAEGLESVQRPHFFGGVATVVAKLLLAGLPDRAYFGEKDFQQLAVIRRMVRDLAIPVEIVGHPTVRAADGLALSSRNAYLGEAERAVAPRLHATLQEVASALRTGTAPEAALAEGKRALTDAGFALDYLEARDADTLAVPSAGTGSIRLLVAARLGRTRLIDNIAV
jgi:pantoate--beta-alanine ligase